MPEVLPASSSEHQDSSSSGIAAADMQVAAHVLFLMECKQGTCVCISIGLHSEK